MNLRKFLNSTNKRGKKENWNTKEEMEIQKQHERDELKQILNLQETGRKKKNKKAQDRKEQGW